MRLRASASLTGDIAIKKVERATGDVQDAQPSEVEVREVQGLEVDLQRVQQSL